MNKAETVAIIRSLLTSKKFGYSIFCLNADFKNETGFDIPLFGYANISDFLHSIPDTVKVTGMYPIEKASLVTNEKSAHIASLVNRQKNSQNKKKPFLGTTSSSRKFAADTRVNQYKTSFKKTVLENSEKGSDCSNGINSVPFDTNPTDTCTEVKVLSNSADKFVSMEDCLGPDDSVPHINVEIHAKVGEYVEVHPCLIFNPYKFYFHFRKLKKKISNFMDKLQVFYTSHNIPKVTKEAAKPKLTCAAFYKRCTQPMWHRVEIHKVVSNSHVIVNFFDHGDMVEISIEHLRHLHRDFMSFPRQAVLGSLANIRPSNGNSCWSTGAIDRFLDLSFGKDLVAGVVQIDPKNFSISVALSQTEDLEIHINDTLVKEGFAEFDPGIFNSSFVNDLKKSNSSNCDKSEKNEILTENTNSKDQFPQDILKPMESIVPSKCRTPVFYFPNNHSSNNNRLKKMFSLVEEK